MREFPRRSNREFVGILYEDINKYEGVAAYTRTITIDELNNLLGYCKKNNWYNLYSHNCSTISVGAWYAAFGVSGISDGFTAKELPIIGGIWSWLNTPGALKKQILSKDSADADYKATMHQILKHWIYGESLDEVDLFSICKINSSGGGGFGSGGSSSGGGVR